MVGISPPTSLHPSLAISLDGGRLPSTSPVILAFLPFALPILYSPATQDLSLHLSLKIQSISFPFPPLLSSPTTSRFAKAFTGAPNKGFGHHSKQNRLLFSYPPYNWVSPFFLFNWASAVRSAAQDSRSGHQLPYLICLYSFYSV